MYVLVLQLFVQGLFFQMLCPEHKILKSMAQNDCKKNEGRGLSEVLPP